MSDLWFYSITDCASTAAAPRLKCIGD